MKKTVEDVASEIAGVTTELLQDTVHWSISGLLTEDEDGDEYDAIHTEVMRTVIKMMYNKYQHTI